VKDMNNTFFNINPYITNKTKLYIQINELASGDLSNLLSSSDKRDELNIIAQTLISIMFFHNLTNSFHNDAHTGNFLYHKIKPGGYFHYNIYGKDYYLENQGYLWVIWDFGIIEPFTFIKNKTNIIVDYELLLRAIKYYKKHLDPLSLLFINELYNTIVDGYKNVYDLTLLTQLNYEIIDYLVKNVSSFTTKKPLNIINPNPYIIS
jgi:predicted unusual protein kinase regulating ubiquinone biosynthesis (AarF/ABC1/UbiB family)